MCWRPASNYEASRALGKREACRVRGCHRPSILTWKALSHPLPSLRPSRVRPGPQFPEASPPAPVATHQPLPTPVLTEAQMGPQRSFLHARCRPGPCRSTRITSFRCQAGPKRDFPARLQDGRTQLSQFAQDLRARKDEAGEPQASRR